MVSSSCNDALHKYIYAMSLNPQKLHAIRDVVRDRMMQSGVDNYAFVDGQLKIGSSHYAVEACGCGEPECDGLRLRRVPLTSGLSAESASRTA